MNNRTDIESRSDVEKLVKVFFEKVLDDELLAPIFLQSAQIDITNHLRVMSDFWESALFQVGKYKGDTINAHLEVHQIHRLETAHFDQWLKLFNETVDDFFEGVKATQAKERARTIAAFIKTKIKDMDRWRLEFNN